MTRRPRVAFVVNGGPGSAMAERAESFAARLAGSLEAPPRDTRLSRGARFSCAAHARVIGDTYLRLAGGG